jgi:hydroxymethylbilane synthase
LCARAGDAATAAAVRAERAVLAALGGGCLMPLGVFARLEGTQLVVTAALAVDGEIRRAELSGDAQRPELLGEQVAGRLR